jgi:chorismate-pyruvate lyase
MRSILLPLLVSVPAAAGTEAPVVLPRGVPARAEALRLLDKIQSALLVTSSATATLEHWCAEQKLAENPHVSAVIDNGRPVPPTPEQRAHLQVSDGETVAYRHVRLTCGGHTLSEAQNWYVPSRLTPAMRAALSGNTPFGKLIEPLHPVRRTLASERLWQPMADGPDAAKHAEAPLLVPHALFRHRALVLDANGHPLAEVAETYTNALLAGLIVR